MKKIISLFKRDYGGEGLKGKGTRLVYNELVEGAEWVADGEGIATKKFDGTCTMYQDGQSFKRYDAKQGKTPPDGFVPAQEPDPVTGHWPGWLKVGDGPEDRWFREGLENTHDLVDGTYELVGPKVQGNPEGILIHTLIPHGEVLYPLCPRTFEGLKEWFKDNDIEGVVFHHPDGRMVKIKASDFGYRRGQR